MTFKDKVRAVIEKKNSLLCVGLDSALDRIPDSMRNGPKPLLDFNKAIIDATAEYAAAFKINMAFYEVYGAEGWKTLRDTFDYIPDKVLKIADAKRGDIGNTARMYARAMFDELQADAVTVNPYMGHDSAQPFLEDSGKGVFFLCLTSNPGSNDFQYFSDGNVTLHQKIAATVSTWNQQGNCGLVVGATHPHELANIRKICPNLPFLIPGIGAQGGDLQASVEQGTDNSGSMALFNSSRAIIYASAGTDFESAAATAARDTRDALNKARIHKTNS